MKGSVGAISFTLLTKVKEFALEAFYPHTSHHNSNLIIYYQVSSKPYIVARLLSTIISCRLEGESKESMLVSRGGEK